MKVLFLSAAVLLAAGLGGCANVKGPSPGLLYSDYNGPVSLGSLDKVTPAKSGKACAENILGAIATGDASIHTAKRNGGITRVASVEHHNTQYYGFYTRFCTVVKGE